MVHISLFSGIGGFDLASERMGWKNVASCEINEFGRKVLQYHFPNAYHHDDIHTLTYSKLNEEITKRHGKEWRSNGIVLSGGFPCQPYSVAGKRKGKDDDRHLWPEMLRAIREIQPTYIVGENVSGLVNWNGGLVFNEVQSEMEAEGYEVTPFILPACAVDAPHRRDRVFFIAYTESRRTGILRDESAEERPRSRNELLGECRRLLDKESNAPDTDSRLQSEQEHGEKESGWSAKKSISNDWQDFPTQSPLCDGNDGISSRLDSITFSKWRNESIKAGGNAIVPQVALQIFKAIQQFDDLVKSNQLTE